MLGNVPAILYLCRTMEAMTKNKGAVIEVNGRVCPLKEGVNVIGRNDHLPIVTGIIKIDGDRTIARYHCKIILKTLPDGIQKAVLTPNPQTRGRICVDGNSVTGGDVVYLFDGSQIILGNTVATFKFL